MFALALPDGRLSLCALPDGRVVAVFVLPAVFALPVAVAVFAVPVAVFARPAVFGLPDGRVSRALFVRCTAVGAELALTPPHGPRRQVRHGPPLSSDDFSRRLSGRRRELLTMLFESVRFSACHDDCR